MKNYICLNGKKVELTAEQVAQLMGKKEKKLREFSPADTFKLGEFKFVVLEHNYRGTEGTAVILKDLYREGEKFGENNNYSGSNVQKICREFAQKMKELVGEENLIEHVVDLTSDDGLDDYECIVEDVSLMTTDMYKRFVRILDKHKIDKWWWLATAWSTPTHDDETWVKCVSPSGSLYFNGYCYCNNLGVRPFCILKSDIFVSC